MYYEQVIPLFRESERELETERRTGDKCFEGDIYGSNRLVVSRVVYGLVITIKIVQHYPAGVKTRDLPWFDHEDA